MPGRLCGDLGIHSDGIFINSMLTLVPALLSLTPGMATTPRAAATRLHAQPRMLIESISTLSAEAFGALPPEAFGNAPSTFVALPQELSDLAPPAHQKFSHIFLAACGAYTTLSAVCTFAPLITRRLMGQGPKEDLERFLASRPESSFGWLNADLRGKPLPATIEELEVNAFPLGMYEGRRVYLCRIQADRVSEARKHLATYSNIEVSRDFSDFYGETVYVCTEP